MPQGWHRLLFNCLIAAAVTWAILRMPISDSNRYLLLALLAGSVVIDFAVHLYLRRNRSNKAFRFLHADTMPKTTTYAELRRQVALSALVYLLIAAVCALVMIMTVFESPIVPILMVPTALAVLVPRKYWSLRRHYRPAAFGDGVGARQLEFASDARSGYGAKLLLVLYVGLVAIVMTSLAIWLTALTTGW